MLAVAQRVSTGIAELFRVAKFSQDNYAAALSATILMKSFNAQQWENSKNVCLQFDVGEKNAIDLLNFGITTIDDLKNADCNQIESVIN